MTYGWIIVNGFLYTKKFSELTDLFVEAAERLNVQLEVKTNTEVYTGIFECETELKRPDFILFWDKDIILARYFETENIPVYNSSQSIEICDDKRRTFNALRSAGLPIPKTICAPMTYENIGFNSYEFLEPIEKQIGFPMVLKEAFGSFGEQVYKIKDHTELYEMARKKQKVPFLCQEFIETSYGQDIRLQVVGNQVVAAMRRFSDHDFRANITAGGQMEKYSFGEEEEKLAVMACKAVGCDFAGVDLLFGKDEFVICEVNSNAHFKNLLDCTGVNTAEFIMNYVIHKEV